MSTQQASATKTSKSAHAQHLRNTATARKAPKAAQGFTTTPDEHDILFNVIPAAQAFLEGQGKSIDEIHAMSDDAIHQAINDELVREGKPQVDWANLQA